MAVNIFSLDYAILLVAFLLIVACNVLKAPERHNRTGKNK
jgi:hypothetical protein